MTRRNWFLLLGLVCWLSTSFAQRDDIVLAKDKKIFAYNSVKELREGALVVRLKTNHRKIAILERTLRDPKLTKHQRKRHQNILDGTIKRRDELNNAIADMFMDSFKFCPVYVMYDTCSAALNKGVRKGLFLNKEKELDPSIELKEEHIFLVNYKKSGGEFPFDVLRVRKLKEKLDEPFPYYITLRESWVNQINTPRAEQAVFVLENRLHRVYARALEYDKKQAKKDAAQK